MRVPAAFLSFVLTLYGCGGGGGGGGSFLPVPAAIVNTAGVDIRDTWKSTEPIASYFGLEGGGGLPRFEGLDASGYAVLGSKNGITYAQRMSGPTDTIDIDFTGASEGYFDSLPDFVRGGIERAGKAWSHRLKDVLGPYMSYDTVVTRKGIDKNGYTIPRLVDGILIEFETDYGNPEYRDNPWRGSSATFRYHQTVGEDFTVRTGWVDVAARTITRSPLWFADIATHEIGHAIGHDMTREGRPRPETIARHVDYERGVWTGPALTAANGGRSVAFQKDRDGDPDFGHLGACAMIMSYCGNLRAIPHEMDFAYMKDIGYTVADDYPAVPELYSYGAWAKHSAWVVTTARHMTFTSTRITDHIAVEADVFGNPSGADFAAAHTGTLSWRGSLLASDMAKFAPVFGEDTLAGAVRFTNLQTAVDVEARARLTSWRKSSLAYDVTVEANGFTDADGKVAGGFYGPDHEEAAGVLNDKAEKILGAFGGDKIKNAAPGETRDRMGGAFHSAGDPGSGVVQRAGLRVGRHRRSRGARRRDGFVFRRDNPSSGLSCPPWLSFHKDRHGGLSLRQTAFFVFFTLNSHPTTLTLSSRRRSNATEKGVFVSKGALLGQAAGPPSLPRGFVRHSGACRNPEQTGVPNRRTAKKNDKAKRQIQKQSPWIPACAGMTSKSAFTHRVVELPSSGRASDRSRLVSTVVIRRVVQAPHTCGP